MSSHTPKNDSDCEYLKHCVVWGRFNTQSKFFWIKSYCLGSKQAQCARKQKKHNNTYVPDNLLPNGDML